MSLVEVETSIGIFKLKAPNAGVRNKALIKAETKDGFKVTIFLTELLPKCVATRPEGVDQTTKIDDVLDSLEMDDYDKLSKAVHELLKKATGNVTTESIEAKK